VNFINNAWATIIRSYSVWLAQVLGWATAYVVFLQSLSPEDQVTLHAAGQIHWIPIGLAFLGIFGGPFVRALKQPNLPNSK
jgi:hypothetical protein